MDSLTDTPAQVGHNRGLPVAIAGAEDLPAEVLTYLTDEHSRLPKQVEELLAEARDLPKVIEDDEAMGKAAKLIKAFRDLTKELAAIRSTEKAPYFRSAQTVDNFFFVLEDKCARRNKTDKPGAADVLQTRLDDYNQRKLRAEQQRRDQEAAASRAEADRLRREEETARQKAESDRLAAERARKPEQIFAKEAVADYSEQVADKAGIEADLAAEKAQEAHIQTIAKPADLVRTRVAEGPTVTMAREPYALVEDYAALDMVRLWPFISDDAKDKALRAWAKTTGYNTPMVGASIGYRQKSVVR